MTIRRCLRLIADALAPLRFCKRLPLIGSENFRTLYVHSSKVTVLYAVAKKSVIFPYLFKEQGNAITANRARFVDTFLEPLSYVNDSKPSTLWTFDFNKTVHLFSRTPPQRTSYAKCSSAASFHVSEMCIAPSRPRVT